MIKEVECPFCLFLKIFLVGGVGAIFGAWLGFEVGKEQQDLIWPSFAGAMAALLFARGWIFRGKTKNE